MLWVSSNRDPHLIIVVSASHIPTPNPLTHTVQFSLLSPIFTSIDRLGDSLQFHRLKLSWCSRLNPSRYLGVVPTAELFCFTFIGALHAESTYPFCFLSSACLLMDKTGLPVLPRSATDLVDSGPNRKLMFGMKKSQQRS